MDYTYNSFYVALSIIVAIFAAYVSLDLANNVTRAKGNSRKIWLGCGALAMGFGIWSMHFVGMLAFDMPGMKMAYDVLLVTVSVLIAVGASALALYIVSRTVVTTPALLAGGSAMAIAIAGMHYVGMFAMRMDARIVWNYSLVALSVLIALIASLSALFVAVKLRKTPDRTFEKVLASVFMGTAIAGMHYVGMFAATFVHADVPEKYGAQVLVSGHLLIWVVIATIFILGLALTGSFVDRLLLRRSESAKDSLQQSEEHFQALVQAIKDYAIFMLDPQGHITIWTSGANYITGYSTSEVLGRHFSMFYTPEEAVSGAPEHELKVAAEEGHFQTEGIRVRKDGSTYWANIVITPLFDSQKRLRGYSKVSRDITSLKETEVRMRRLNEELEKRVEERTAEIRQRAMQLRLITNALPVLVGQVDSNLRIMFANEAFCQWLKTTPQEVIGAPMQEVLGEKFDFHLNYFKRALAGEVVSYERVSEVDGLTASFHITYVPEFDTDGKVSGFILVANDVSPYKKIEAELKSAKEAAEVANATKSAFLANMSHEIRTPLGAILGFSELILNNEMTSAEKVKAMEVMRRNGRLLSGIINDILDLSKVEAGKLEVEKIDVPFDEVLAEIESLLSLDATEKGIQLRVHATGAFPAVVKTDPVRLRQILLNIVGNAIKFTAKGSIDITLGMVEVEGQRKKLSFEVKDTGRGIRPEQVERLFIPFSQADVSTTREFGGTGLGLVLSKKLANALGGDVVLNESTPGRGSRFTITIDPGASAYTKIQNYNTLNRTQQSHSFEDMPDLNNVKILIVDDSVDNQILAQHFLKKTGAELEMASNGAEGVEKALRGEYHMVLMDLQMPIMDGYQATRELRSKDYKKPIIALTAHAMKEERKRCLESGFNDHLSKPITRELLLKTVSQYSRSL